MSSIIVVEGIHDEMRIKSIFPQAQVLTTNGREIDPNTLSLVKKLSEDHSIIVLTDPDGPGEKFVRFYPKPFQVVSMRLLGKRLYQ